MQSRPLPILFNNENKIFKISGSVTKVYECNHEEVDSKTFHQLHQNINVAVCSKDVDILVLMVMAYALNKINEKWVIKIECIKFINIRKIVPSWQLHVKS